MLFRRFRAGRVVVEMGDSRMREDGTTNFWPGSSQIIARKSMFRNNSFPILYKSLFSIISLALSTASNPKSHC